AQQRVAGPPDRTHAAVANGGAKFVTVADHGARCGALTAGSAAGRLIPPRRRLRGHGSSAVVRVAIEIASLLFRVADRHRALSCVRMRLRKSRTRGAKSTRQQSVAAAMPSVTALPRHTRRAARLWRVLRSFPAFRGHWSHTGREFAVSPAARQALVHRAVPA